MGLDFIVTKRVFGFKPEKEEKYVVKSIGSGEVSFSKLCNRVSQICGAHRGTVQLVIAGLVDVMINDLDDGKSVKLGEFGTFRPAVNAKAVDNEEEATASTIYRKKIVFTPGKSLKRALEDMSVTRMATYDTDYTDGSSGNNSGGNNSGGGNPDDEFIDPTA